MNPTGKHSAFPWQRSEYDSRRILAGNGRSICAAHLGVGGVGNGKRPRDSEDEAQANADFILEASEACHAVGLMPFAMVGKIDRLTLQLAEASRELVEERRARYRLRRAVFVLHQYAKIGVDPRTIEEAAVAFLAPEPDGPSLGPEPLDVAGSSVEIVSMPLSVIDLHSSIRLPRRVKDNADYQERINYEDDYLFRRITAFIFGESVHRESVPVYFSVPRSWWQHFKATSRLVPQWWRARWPALYDKVVRYAEMEQVEAFPMLEDAIDPKQAWPRITFIRRAKIDSPIPHSYHEAMNVPRPVEPPKSTLAMTKGRPRHAN